MKSVNIEGRRAITCKKRLMTGERKTTPSCKAFGIDAQECERGCHFLINESNWFLVVFHYLRVHHHPFMVIMMKVIMKKMIYDIMI